MCNIFLSFLFRYSNMSIKESFDYQSEINFKYFIFLAFKKEISWDSLAIILDGLTTTLQRSKVLNNILLEELKLSEEREEAKSRPSNEKIFSKSDENIEVQTEKFNTGNQNDINSFDQEKKDTSEIVETEIQDNVQNEKDLEINSISKAKDEIKLNEFNDKDLNMLNSIKNDSKESKKSVFFDFEYDFVGSNGTVTRRLALNAPFENEKLNNFDLSVQEDDEIDDVKENKSKNQGADLPKGEKKYQCKMCDKSFAVRNSLYRHKFIHMDENPFKCTTCSKACSNRPDLKKHERVHTGERPFICKTCKKAFSQLGDLKKHERIHTGEKPYKCKICAKSFSTSTYLIIHERIHTGEKPFQCKICKKCFRFHAALQTHVRLHSGEKPYQCKTCDKKFAALSSLNYHVKRCEPGEEKTLSCKNCGKYFTTLSLLIEHESEESE